MFTYHIRTSPPHRHTLVLFIFELSPCLDLGYLSLSLNPITHPVSSLSDSRLISITSVVHRYLLPMFFETSTRKQIFLTQIITIFHLYMPATSLWDWRYIWQNPSIFMNLQRVTATHFLAEPSSWLHALLTCPTTPTLNELHTTHFTHAFPLFLNFPFLHIQPPLILPPNLLHTTIPKCPPLNQLLPPRMVSPSSNKMVTNAPYSIMGSSVQKSFATLSLDVTIMSPTRRLLITSRWSKSWQHWKDTIHLGGLGIHPLWWTQNPSPPRFPWALQGHLHAYWMGNQYSCPIECNVSKQKPNLLWLFHCYTKQKLLTLWYGLLPQQYKTS